MPRAVGLGEWDQVMAPGQVVVLGCVVGTFELRLSEVLSLWIGVNHAFMVAADSRDSIRWRVDAL